MSWNSCCWLCQAVPEVSCKVRILVQTGIAVGRKYFAMGINIDAGSFRLFEKLVQVFQIVPGNNDEGTFFDVRVHSCRNGIAERGRVGGIQKLHAAIVDLPNSIIRESHSSAECVLVSSVSPR